MKKKNIMDGKKNQKPKQENYNKCTELTQQDHYERISRSQTTIEFTGNGRTTKDKICYIK